MLISNVCPKCLIVMTISIAVVNGHFKCFNSI